MNDPHHRYHWVAHYQDGSIHNQFIQDGALEQSIGVLDFTQITKIELIPVVPDYPPVELRINLAENEKAIKFWLHDFNAMSGDLTESREVLGIQKNVNGVATYFFVYFSLNGSVVISTSRNP